MHFNYHADGECSTFISKAYSRKFCILREFCFERKMKSEMKLNSEHLFELATPEINTIWRIHIFLILPKYKCEIQ